MNSKKTFWGFFLLTLGVLFLTTKYNLITGSFGFIWDTWPLIFVFWGAIVIFKHSIIRPVLSAMFGVFLALLIFGMIQNTFFSIDDSGNYEGRYTENYNENYDPSIKTASLELSSGAGTFIIKGSTDKLIEGKTGGVLADYDFRTDKEDSSADIYFRLNKKDGNIFHGKLRNYLQASLNQNPVWDLNFNLGASKSKFDLSDYKVRDLTLHTGATSTQLKLGDKYDSTNVEIEMGAASVSLLIPKSSACSIHGDMVLMSREFPGFSKRDSNHYETENFYTASKKIFISINGGVSSVKVIRY